MIDYLKGVYGFNLLLRVHGSALYKGSLFGLLAVLVYLNIELGWNDVGGRADDDLDHPYGIGVLVSSVTFLIIFRANYGYQRYNEACEALHTFMSKWMDATISAAVFHLQSPRYDGARPPSYFDHDQLNKLGLTRDRTRTHGGKDSADSVDKRRRLLSVYDCRREPSGSDVQSEDTFDDAGEISHNQRSSPSRSRRLKVFTRKSPLPDSLLHGYYYQWDAIQQPRDVVEASPAMLHRTVLNAQLFPSSQCADAANFACRPDGAAPPLFLQELAHLSSLSCAVALATLRNDTEEGESPLGVFVPGMEWPCVDPDALPANEKLEFQSPNTFVHLLRHWFGVDRLPQYRSEYNAARPLLVIGGVSDGEIKFLQIARGSHAKVQITLAWLGEFMVREHLAGSFGPVNAAIVSRLIQYLSDGMMHYHQARKIMYIPFPFPHAQLSAFFTACMVFAVPFLLDQYTNVIWLGSLISFLTVTCLAGLHEVGRELENPFRNVPNELPINTLQALYNEALVTMFSGYNPDSYWDAEMYEGQLDDIATGRSYRPQTNIDEAEGECNSSAAIETILEIDTKKKALNKKTGGKLQSLEVEGPSSDYHLFLD